MSVHLHTSLRRRTAAGLVRHLELDLPPGSTLGDLLSRLEILEYDGILLVVNGRTAEPGQGLREGDVVNLIPAVSGG
ncbi:MAG: MoaD/ThiS family protein [Holophaga sp.]